MGVIGMRNTNTDPNPDLITGLKRAIDLLVEEASRRTRHGQLYAAEERLKTAQQILKPVPLMNQAVDLIDQALFHMKVESHGR